jgi:GT2 family glycosyltransferase/peptidoglycan/xylan/chitin deacetylase (PgdA/CDA1 family)
LTGAAPRYSVVIPTYQRREIVTATVAALDRQRQRSFEVVVVVDGSSDGSAEALRGLGVDFPLTVLEQANQGRAAAVNAGARASKGELIVFLDDDMEADPGLLEEHGRCHDEGADVALGDLPLNPRSPRDLISWGVGLWARDRRDRLAAPGAEIGLGDLLTGQMSISRAAYDAVGGFDPSFTREGLFGGEDIDFGYRLLKAGYRIVFNPAAISYQYYEVDPDDYLRRAREAGRSDRELIVKHPELAGKMGSSPSFKTRRSRWLLAPLVVAPAAFGRPLRAVAVALARTGRTGSRLRRFFFSVRTLEYLRGVRSARRQEGDGGAVVLAYHALSDLSDDRVLAQYGITPERFAAQLDMLARRGHRFVGLGALLAALEGRAALPPRAVLVTFDDAYADLVPGAGAALAERGIPAVVFAVSGQIGGSNEWDRWLGAASLPLLDVAGLRALIEAGIEIGSHGATHRPLTSLDGAEVRDELEASAAQIEAAGLPRPRAFAYPHGEWTPEAASAAASAGYEAAFTIDPGVAGRGGNRWALPRIEVLASDSHANLRLKIRTCAWPKPLRDRLLRLAGVRV